MVLRRCRKLLWCEELAVEAMQDTFVKILRYKDSLNADHPSSMIYTIATNVCLNIIRQHKNEPKNSTEELLMEIACADDIETNAIINNLLVKIFFKEKESTKTIAVLYYVDGMTHDQVANAVDMSISGVRKRLSKLKSMIEFRMEPSNES